MSVVRETTKRRHRKMFNFFNHLIEKKGTEAKYLSREYFYQLVSEEFDMSVEHTAVILRGMIKQQEKEAQKQE